jgi:hypothetical protein
MNTRPVRGFCGVGRLARKGWSDVPSRGILPPMWNVFDDHFGANLTPTHVDIMHMI